MVGTTPIQLMINIQVQFMCMHKEAIYQLPMVLCMSFLLESMFWVLKILFIELNFQVVAEKKKILIEE